MRSIFITILAALALASGVAFLVSETADFGIYTPLAKRRFLLAVLLSSTVGLLLDSALFLYLAFDSLDHFWGQVVGKGWAVLAAMPVLWWVRRKA